MGHRLTDLLLKEETPPSHTCLYGSLTADPILALLLCCILQLYPFELVEAALVPSRCGCVWLSHHTSTVDITLRCWARNHCLLTCPCCVQGFAGLMVLKTNPSDPPPKEIILGFLGCRCICVEQGEEKRTWCIFQGSAFSTANLFVL